MNMFQHQLMSWVVIIAPLILLIGTIVDRPDNKWNKMLRIFGLALTLSLLLTGLIFFNGLWGPSYGQKPTYFANWHMLSQPLRALAAMLFAVGYFGLILERKKKK